MKKYLMLLCSLLVVLAGCSKTELPYQIIENTSYGHKLSDWACLAFYNDNCYFVEDNCLFYKQNGKQAVNLGGLNYADGKKITGNSEFVNYNSELLCFMNHV